MKQKISDYTKKRNFNITSEPSEEKRPPSSGTAQALRFVVQKHDARNLHYDFRLELDGTLKSWAIPKGPSLDPKNKRLAVHVEDHPISYAKFEGAIPQGQYGGGDVIVWDEGIWQPHSNPRKAYTEGKLKFTLVGEKLTGDWTLVKTRLRGNSDKEQWLLIKEQDAVARPETEFNLIEQRPESVITGELLPVDKTQSINTQTKKKATTALKSTQEKESIKSTLPKNSTPPHQSTSVKNKPKPPAKKSRQDASTSIPATLSPTLATLAAAPPEGNWLYEIKFDGYRILARVLKGDVSLFTRTGKDWTQRLPLQAAAIKALGLKDSWLDGEVVVLNEKGLPSFQALQNAFDNSKSDDIVFYLFDAPFLNGVDMRAETVQVRKTALKRALTNKLKTTDSGPLRYSAEIDGDAESILHSACALSLEGVIGKRIDSTYSSRRSTDWIKLKCRLRQEFVIIGYTAPKGSRAGFGAILLGIQNEPDGELVYAGKVGTGFNTKQLNDIFAKMHALESKIAPITKKNIGMRAADVYWVKPILVCEVEFAEWTAESVLRQAAFISLRDDKPARMIIREQAVSPKTITANLTTKQDMANRGITEYPEKNPRKNTKKLSANQNSTSSTASSNSEDEIAGVAISHPDRLLDTESGSTKMDVVTFYQQVAQVILPHLSQRPVSLLRAPEGISGEQFFQKHTENRAIPYITQLDAALDPGHAPLMQIDTVQALIGCAQLNTLELHTWGAKSSAIEAPDRFILDLDPDPALPWRSVVEATSLTLCVLDELKLQAFLKTTGGKGMHIIVPLTPDAGWDYVKAFSKAISEFMTKQIPERFVAKMGPKNRVGKIFTDYLRNTRGASTVCAYSARARPGLTVSVPISRKELESIKQSNYWTIHNIHTRLEKLKTNPWEGYTGEHYDKVQKITKAMWKKLGLSEPK
ncbi:MAG TPA: DNA ligase D [Cellvibrionaceae bacterium]